MSFLANGVLFLLEVYSKSLGFFKNHSQPCSSFRNFLQQDMSELFGHLKHSHTKPVLCRPDNSDSAVMNDAVSDDS